MFLCLCVFVCVFQLHLCTFLCKFLRCVVVVVVSLFLSSDVASAVCFAVCVCSFVFQLQLSHVRWLCVSQLVLSPTNSPKGKHKHSQLLFLVAVVLFAD